MCCHIKCTLLQAHSSPGSGNWLDAASLAVLKATTVTDRLQCDLEPNPLILTVGALTAPWVVWEVREPTYIACSVWEGCCLVGSGVGAPWLLAPRRWAGCRGRAGA
jgi:hypothetical protein